MIIQADARHIPLADESVNCVVTSPPYWGLRDYGIPPSIWGGDPNCMHQWCEHIQPAANGINHKGGMSGKTLSGSSATRKQKRSDFCLCGAWRGQLGLEPTPEMFIEHIVVVFREVRRVLRKDGTIWVNLGDSYAGSWGNYHPNSPPGKHGQRLKQSARWNRPAYQSQKFLPPTANIKGLKPKDLCGIPWRVALALQADGWWLRSEIIWAKPNPMPESVTDRPTRAHEYIFLLTKSARYFYDADAIREDSIDPESINGRRKRNPRLADQSGDKLLVQNIWKKDGKMEKRNARSVWQMTTQAYPEAHFATFPEELARRCILAGCPVGGMVLDPFVGSGTTVLVAEKNQRIGIGLELKWDYCKLAIKRTTEGKGGQMLLRRAI